MIMQKEFDYLRLRYDEREMAWLKRVEELEDENQHLKVFKAEVKRLRRELAELKSGKQRLVGAVSGNY
ncbi:MAG: hypothetical protein GY742_02190 [Hyphomicrobiales bacterium]|nr:hypothetical protein [Hyphomicrobiales bacterium]